LKPAQAAHKAVRISEIIRFTLHKITDPSGPAGRGEHTLVRPRHRDFEATAEENDQLNEI
jgi:hypothetical protein